AKAKAEPKAEGVKTEGAAVAAASGEAGAGNKTVKTLTNQFAMNRLLLMLMDVKPEALSAETIDDVKKESYLLLGINAEYAFLNWLANSTSGAKTEVPKAEPKAESAKTEGAAAPAPVAAASGEGGAGKTMTNQSVMNRMLLMLMDVKPETLS